MTKQAQNLKEVMQLWDKLTASQKLEIFQLAEMLNSSK